MGTTSTHRVVCGDYVQEARSLEAAQVFARNVEAARACPKHHTIEVRVGSEWVALHVATARVILAAPMLAKVETLDGPMVKVGGSWSAEVAERAEAAVDPATDPAGWRAAIGPHEEATVTSDGRVVGVGAWCDCAGLDSAGWVRFERWTTAGRVSHGYACPECRRITQTG